MSVFNRVVYSDLNSRQQENYNFQKVAGELADYGFNCLRLTDDWQGADFIACHVDGDTFLKVQLKGRLTIDLKYREKDVYVAFLDNGDCYVYGYHIGNGQNKLLTVLAGNARVFMALSSEVGGRHDVRI